MTQEELNAHPGWECCTFEGAEMHTLLLGLKSTFREKLEWLEAAETMTLQLRAAREEREKPKVETDNVKPGFFKEVRSQKVEGPETEDRWPQ